MDDQNPVHVVGHDDEHVQPDVGKMSQDVQPTPTRDASGVIQNHSATDDPAEQRSSAIRANRYKIRTEGCVIVVWQPNRSAGPSHGRMIGNRSPDCGTEFMRSVPKAFGDAWGVVVAEGRGARFCAPTRRDPVNPVEIGANFVRPYFRNTRPARLPVNCPLPTAIRPFTITQSIPAGY